MPPAGELFACSSGCCFLVDCPIFLQVQAALRAVPRSIRPECEEIVVAELDEALHRLSMASEQHRPTSSRSASYVGNFDVQDDPEIAGSARKKHAGEGATGGGLAVQPAGRLQARTQKRGRSGGRAKPCQIDQASPAS